MVSAKDLKIVICPGQWPTDSETYDAIFNCWYSVWDATFKELGKDTQLKSDAFTRQDQISAIFVKDQCAALQFFRRVDPHRPSFQTDSYFSNWSELHLKQLRRDGDDILVCSNFTVHPIARGKTLGFSMKDMLVGLATKCLVDLDVDAMTGALRRDRHVNDACERWGALPIARNIPSGHGDYVDLMAFYKKHILNFKRPEISELLDEVWDRRYIIDSRYPTKATIRKAG